jgi:predicted Zn-dependent protease
MILISPGEEAEMGATAFAETKAKEKISNNAEDIARVQRVGRRIAEAVGGDLPTAKWEFVVFEDAKTVNAFALPGGKVGVYSGLLDLTDSDAELAIVMGHEIGHVTARHGAERISQGIVTGLIGVGVGVATNNKKNQDLIRAGYGLAAAGATLAFSRANETEADYIGIRYAAKAGYDPRAAITFWQKMAKAKDGAGTFKWLSTHPTHADRIADLERRMPVVLPLYETARKRYGE